MIMYRMAFGGKPHPTEYRETVPAHCGRPLRRGPPVATAQLTAAGPRSTHNCASYSQATVVTAGHQSPGHYLLSFSCSLPHRSRPPP
jgi:hypothetical protein